MGGIDGLVNAAGIERHIDPQDITDDDWDVLMAINVTGTFLTNQAAFRYMREQGGRILNFGSDAGLLAYPSARSEEHTSELQSLMRISYAVFCLKKKK